MCRRAGSAADSPARAAFSYTIMQKSLHLPTDSFIPREYQLRAAIEAQRATIRGDSPIVVSATGTGKTSVIAMICRDWPGPVLVLTHRLVIREQLIERIADFCPVGEVYRHRHDQERVLVAPIDTMHHRLDKFDRRAFGLIIVDEAHRAATREFSEVFEHFETARRIGFTATPDHVPREWFTGIGFEFSIAGAIADGWLTPLRVRQMPSGPIPEVYRVALTVADLTGGTIVFSQSVEHGRLIVDACRQHGTTAELMTAQTPRDERKRMIASFKARNLAALVNYGVISEGFDASSASNIVIAREVSNRALCAQIVGRGLRPSVHLTDEMGPEGRRAAIAASSKPFCTVIDFGANLIHHNLASYTPSKPRNRNGHRLIAATKTAEPYQVDPLDRYRADEAYRLFFKTAEQQGMSERSIRKLLGV